MKTGLISGGIALIATLGFSAIAFAGMSADGDLDGIYDVLDNCSSVFQDVGAGEDCDTDDDGYGNRCDGDFDQDGSTFPGDFILFNADFLTTVDSGIGSDMDCDGYVFPSDFILFNTQFTTTTVPGPSGLHCAGTVPCDL
jgi:hypothetical protein